MNSSTTKRLIAGVLLILFLSACVPYHQAYYPAGGYSSYGAQQGYNYGGHPHNNHNTPPHLDHHEGNHYLPSWNSNGYGHGYNHHNPSNHGGGQQHYGYGNDHHGHHGNH